MTQAASTTEVVDPFAGFALGMAVGDSLGLPREGLAPRRASRLYGSAPLRHHFVFGYGMVSDDTEHMVMTALALLAEPDDSVRFARCLARNLRWWLVGLPAGVGLATAKSIIRLWLGWSPASSGVRSAGNGPAMRAGVLGLCLHRDEAKLREYVLVSTRLTHTDPRAETGAILIALAARTAVQSQGIPINIALFLETCRADVPDGEWQPIWEQLQSSLANGESAAQFAGRLGLQRGVTGYIVHTVAAVLFCWLRWPGEFRRPMEAIIELGGDADTTAAILGGLLGASCGADSIPPEWLDGLIEWPCSVTWMRGQLAPALRFVADADSSAALQLSRWRWLVQLVRNALFLVIVLFHGFRRLLPPY